MRVLKSLWSAHFAAPRLTVLAPNPQAVEAGFRARHREAFAHPQLWSADIAFMQFDWDAASIGAELLDAVESRARQAYARQWSPPAPIPATSISRSRSSAPAIIGQRWPVPIFMRETSQSEFSQQYAKGDETPELDAYLQAFGAHQITATRARIIDGELDHGAAVAHEHYNKGLGNQDPDEHARIAGGDARLGRCAGDLPRRQPRRRRQRHDQIMGCRLAPAAKGEKGDTAPIGSG